MYRTEIPPALLALAARQYRLVSVCQAQAYGISAQRCVSLVRQGRWSRVTRGVYDTDAAYPSSRWPDRDAHARAAVAALLRYGPDAVAVAISALALLGADGLPSRVAPTVALPSDRHGGGRSSLLRQYAGMEVRTADGWPVAAAAWALAQAIPGCDRDTAVSILDSAQYLHVADPAVMADALELLRGRRGGIHARSCFALTDGRAQSPLETRVRLRCHDGGVPPDDLQVPIYSATGTHLGDGDMGWRLPGGRWLIAEADGQGPHSEPVALLRDRKRQNDFVVASNVVTRFTWDDTRLAAPIPRTIRALLRAAA